MKRKKKFLALVLAAVMLLSSITIALAVTTADNVKLEGFDMPDKALLQAFLDNGADANWDGVLTVAEMEDVTYLYADWYENTGREKIQNLSGIEVAKNLEYVALDNNSIEDITPLKSLKNLEQVNLYNNQVSDEALYSLLDALTEGKSYTLLENDYIEIASRFVYIASNYFSGGMTGAAVFNTKIAMTDDLGYLRAKSSGTTTLTVTFGDTLTKEFPVTVLAPEAPLTNVSSALPILDSKYGTLIDGNSGTTALYPNGDLYYIGNHGEVLLAKNVRNYVATHTYGYYAHKNYWNRFNILDNNSTLWGWGWDQFDNGGTDPSLKRIAEGIVSFDSGVALNQNGQIIDIRLDIGNEHTNEVLLDDVIQMDGYYALRCDGSVWSSVSDSVWESIYSNPYDRHGLSLLEIVYRPVWNTSGVSKLIGNGFAVKEDGTTWAAAGASAEEGFIKIADFSAKTATSFAISSDEYVYFAVDQQNNLWKIDAENVSKKKIICENFFNWAYYNDRGGISGFYTSDGKLVDFHGYEDEFYLSGDSFYKSVPTTRDALLLTSVASFSVIEPFSVMERGVLAVRSDGSIWAYHFNGVGMDIPVMIKAPIGAASYALGDVNLDGKVNTSDARLALRGAATLETLTDQQILAADVNKNGKADTSDARKILRVAANLDQF